MEPWENYFAWSFDSDFQYNLDDNYGTVEGDGHLSGEVILSALNLSIEGQITFNGEIPSQFPEIYLIATDGEDKEFAKQYVNFSDIRYEQINSSTYNFTVQIRDAIQPINGGHYEILALITYNSEQYYFFVNTNSLINSHYFPLLPIWSFAIITDLHIGYGIPDYGTEGWDDDLIGDPKFDEYYLTERLRRVVNWINENKDNHNIEFVVVLGDFAHRGERSAFKKAKQILDELDIPYFPVVGNHDIDPCTQKSGTVPDLLLLNNKEIDPGIYSSSIFREVFSDKFIREQCKKLGVNCKIDENNERLNYFFTYKNYTFLFLDTSKGDGHHSLVYWMVKRLIS